MDKFVRSKWDVVMLLYAAFEVFLFGGITYGWPNLVRALKEENYFAEHCSIGNSSLSINSTVKNSVSSAKSCADQDDHFGMVYNVASVITGIGNILIGTAVDKLPMVVTRLMFISFFLIGALCTALSSPDSPNLLFPGMLFIRIGGFLFYYTNLRLANIAPRIKGTIITIYSGLFDSSSSVLYIILMAYYSGIEIQMSFTAYTIALIVPFVFTFVLFPVQKIHLDGQFKRFPQIFTASKPKSVENGNQNTKPIPIASAENLSEVVEYSEVKMKDPKEIDIKLSKRTKWKSWLEDHDLDFFTDIKYYLLLLTMSVLTLRKEFFVISYDAALVNRANGDHRLVDYYSGVFGVAQFFAILVTPIGGVIIDYSRSKGSMMAYVWQFAFTIMCGVLLCICAFVVPIEIMYLANIDYVVCRALTYSIAAAYISDTYPMKMFGSILGSTESVGYLLSLLQYPLFAWSNNELNKDYRIVNGIIMILCLFALAHPINLFFHYRSKAKEDMKIDGDKEMKDEVGLIA